MQLLYLHGVLYRVDGCAKHACQGLYMRCTDNTPCALPHLESSARRLCCPTQGATQRVHLVRCIGDIGALGECQDLGGIRGRAKGGVECMLPPRSCQNQTCLTVASGEALDEALGAAHTIFGVWGGRVARTPRCKPMPGRCVLIVQSLVCIVCIVSGPIRVQDAVQQCNGDLRKYKASFFLFFVETKRGDGA